ncbi:MAG: pyruvate kinase [Candidatus Brocadiae bacterium]|nr:pyruvate kinase [Candidatus Brocadiia bacterium]
MRRTKILATLGPASSTPEVIARLVDIGLDAVRLNFSHGTHESHAALFGLVREAARKSGRPIAILQDLQGPKIRVGKVRPPGMEVPTGSQLTITTRPVEGADGVVSTEYADLPRDVRKDETILLDDGNIRLSVREVRGRDILCDVTDGGRLTSHKGINVPGAALSTGALSAKDREDALFGLRLGVDFVALSFVRSAGDVAELKDLMKRARRTVPIIAKIEKPQAMDALDGIVAAADGVMVARGDLGVEASLEMIPVFQKRIIRVANRAGKLVITATQMLESMTTNPTPTRAEVTDVANAILDGTDALMLSGETAVGQFPVETVRRMSRIAETTEEKIYPFDRAVSSVTDAEAGDFTPAVVRLAGHAARECDPKALLVFTRSGRSARLLSDERPRAPILGFTSSEEVARRLALYWGVLPRLIPELESVERLFAVAERELLESRLARNGDTVVYVLGSNLAPGATNSLKVARVGDVERETRRRGR